MLFINPFVTKFKRSQTIHLYTFLLLQESFRYWLHCVGLFLLISKKSSCIYAYMCMWMYLCVYMCERVISIFMCIYIQNSASNTTHTHQNIFRFKVAEHDSQRLLRMKARLTFLYWEHESLLNWVIQFM